MATDWVARVNETAQEQVPEPVVASGILQPAGTWGSFGLDQVSGVAAMFKRRKVNKDAGGLARTSWKGTKTVLLAVAGDKLYAFAAKQKGRTSPPASTTSSRRRPSAAPGSTSRSWPRSRPEAQNFPVRPKR